MVQDVAHFLAKLFNIPLPVICSQTVLNSKNFFKCQTYCFFWGFFLGGKSREINKIQSIILSLPIVLYIVLYTALYYCIYLLSLVCCAQFLGGLSLHLNHLIA